MNAQQLENIDTHAQRAWGLASMLRTYLNQDVDQLSKQAMSEAVAEIWERLDAIGAEFHSYEKEAAQ